MDFSVYVIVFECVMIIMFGAFCRLDSASLSNVTYFTNGSLFLLGFAMISVSKKSLSWLSIGNLLVILALAFQWNLLWYQFWSSCFNGFATSFDVSINLFLNCLSCALCTLLSMTDFLGRVDWRQLLIICLVQSIGFSLNSSILTFGLKAFDGGGGMQVFLMSGVYSFCMWFIGFRSQGISFTKPVYTYPGVTFSLIGLAFILYGWPSFNVGGAIVYSTSIANSLAQSSLAGCAYVNTVLALSVSIISAFLFHTPSHKMNIQDFIYAVINGGIIVASFTDVLINPVGVIIPACLASVATITVLKHLKTFYVIEHLPDSTFRLAFGLLSGVLAAIVVAARNNVTPTLAQDLLAKGGIQLAALVVTLGIGALFGMLSALVIRLLPGPAKQDMCHDKLMWDIKDECMPINPQTDVQRDTLDSNRLGEDLMVRRDREEQIPSYFIPSGSGVKKTRQVKNEDRDAPHHEQVDSYKGRRQESHQNQRKQKHLSMINSNFGLPPPDKVPQTFSRSVFTNSRHLKAQSPILPIPETSLIQPLKQDFKKPESPGQIRRVIEQHPHPQINDGPQSTVARRLDYDQAAVVAGEDPFKPAN